MKTKILAAFDADGTSLNSAAIARAAALLLAGRLVAFPTETVYGLGADALSPDAVARIFGAKGRPANNPVIVHVADVGAARALTTDWPDSADRLAAAFWPGPLTLVLPKSELVPEIVTAGGHTVAVRIPAHPVALALLRKAGVPIAAPSANRSMLLSPTTAEHVLASLAGRIDAVLDGGSTPGGIESTVISLAGERPRLLRPGLITPAQIEGIVGPIERGPGHPEGTRGRGSGNAGAGALPAPGMLARHYSPRAPLEVSAEGEERVRILLAEGHRVGWLTRAAGVARRDRLVPTEMPEDPEGYASQLYAALHALDAAGVTRIVVDALPSTDDWLALSDRLRRASTPSTE